MSKDLNKIPLDNRGDVRFLKHQVAMAIEDSQKELHAVIESQTKRLDSKHKAMVGNRLKEILDKWQNDIFAMAGANMTVNELEYAVAMEDLVETEPFDRDLKNMTIELQNEVEELTLQLVDKRRNLPLQVADLIGRTFKLEQKLLDDKVDTRLELLESNGQTKRESLTAEKDVQEQEWLQLLPTDRLKKEYKIITKRVAELSKTLPAAVGQIERVTEYLQDHINKLDHPEPEAQLLLSGASSQLTKNEKGAQNKNSETRTDDKHAKQTVSLREKSALTHKLRRGRQQRHAPYTRK